MTKVSTISLIAALALSSANALAAGSIDARLAGSAIEIDVGDTVEIDATGFEFRGDFDIADQLSLRGSYVNVSGDEASLNGSTGEVDTTFSIIRVGPAYSFTDAGSNTSFYGAFELAKISAEVEGESDDETGFDLVVGLRDKGASKFLWDAEIGYVSVKKTKGAVVQGTIGYRFNPAFALVGGIQGYALEDEDNSEITISNATLGLRITF